MLKLDTSAAGRMIRTNSGYWDGVAARAAFCGHGRLPVWNKSSVHRCAHPFDKLYGQGFWIGWYGDPTPKGANG